MGSESGGGSELDLRDARHLVGSAQAQPMVHVVQIPSCSMSCKPAICIHQTQTLATRWAVRGDEEEHVCGLLAGAQSYDTGNGFGGCMILLV